MTATTLTYTIARDSILDLDSKDRARIVRHTIFALENEFEGADVDVGFGDARAISGTAVDAPGAYERAREVADRVFDAL